MGSKTMRETFTESAFSAPREIDEANHVIKGVKVLGGESRNGRRYSDAAMMRAPGLYEGVNVNIDHPDQAGKTRGVMESVGVLKNVRYEKAGLFADFHYLESHPHTKTIIERAKRFPNNFGLSHNAEGKATRKDGKLIVESIDRVRSVDLVTNPATVTGLFEGEEMADKITLKEFAQQTKNELLLKLVEDGEMAAMPMDAPPEDASSDDQAKAAFEQMIVAAFRDDALDTKATLAKIKDILKSYEKLTGDGGSEKKDEPPADDKATESLRAEVADLRKMLVEQAIDSVKASTGLREEKLDESQRTKLAACKTAAEAKSFIEGLPAAYRGGAVPFKPGALHRDKPQPGYKSTDEFLESIGRKKRKSA